MKKRKLFLMCALMAGSAFGLAAMPTEAELEREEPAVKRLLASEHAALASGKMTRTEVAAAAMDLAEKADTEAAKLLLMKGAFVLYVRDGNLEKAVETMNALESAIADMPPEYVENMVELSLLGVSKKEDAARLRQLLGEAKKEVAKAVPVAKDRTTVQSIIDGMIKVPGRDYWLSETELTQGQWEAVMGYNLSEHKGANLPVENVSHDDCCVFLEKLNQTKEVLASQFEFRLPDLGEWKYAAWAGSAGKGSWIKPGVVGNVLDMAWVQENSSNQTHAVAAKSPNAFGFYDMFGNVWEYLGGGYVKEGPWKGCAPLKGCTYHQAAAGCTWNANNCLQRHHRRADCGLRVAAHIRPANRKPLGTKKCEETPTEKARKDVGRIFPGWSLDTEVDAASGGFRDSHRGQSNVIVAHPMSKEKPSILSRTVTLSDKNPCLFLKVASFDEGSDFLLSVRVNGKDALSNRRINTPDYSPWEDLVVSLYDWRGSKVKIEIVLTANDWWCEHPFLSRIEIAEGKGDMRIVEGKVTVDGYTWSYRAQNGEAAISANNSCAVWPNPKGDLVIPATLDGFRVTSIETCAFAGCGELKSVTIPSGVKRIMWCAFYGCKALASVEIPSGVKSIEHGAFAQCAALTSITLPESVVDIGVDAFLGCSGLTSVTIPASVKIIRKGTFLGCKGLASVAIPPSVTNIGMYAFKECGQLKSVTIPESVKSIGREAFRWCGALESVKLPSGLNVLEHGVVASTGLKSVTIPSNVTSIEQGAIAGCTKLESVTIPHSVTNIGIDAFRGSGQLKSVVIPSSVRAIADHALSDCGNLTSVTMLGERPNAPDNVFVGSGKLVVIYVPANATSWAGMKEWQGIPLVIDANVDGTAAVKDRTTIQSIIDGMIKVPGRDCWLSETEVTQGQWEAVMGYNLSEHKGANFPVECVCRDDCDVFLEKLNQTKEACASQFEFVLPSAGDWRYAAAAGGAGDDCWIRPGVAGNILDMAWVKENGSNLTHGVATKAPNVFGFYDMLGNVWEWMQERDDKARGLRHGASCCENAADVQFRLHHGWLTPRSRRYGNCGLRVAAHARPSGKKPIETKTSNVPFTLLGPYGLRIEAAPGCEKGAERLLQKLKDVYLPCAVRYFGDPFEGKAPSRTYTIKIERNKDESRSSRRLKEGPGEVLGLAKSSDEYDMFLHSIAADVLTVCEETDWTLSFYVRHFIEGDLTGINPVPRMREEIRRSLEQEYEARKSRLGAGVRLEAVLEELRERHPDYIRKYFALKNRRFAEKKLPNRISNEQMGTLLGEVTGENVAELFKKYEVGEKSWHKVPCDALFSTNTLFTISGSYATRVMADPGCERGAESILKELEAYLPNALEYYGEPVPEIGSPLRVYMIDVRRNDGIGVCITNPSSWFNSDGCLIGLAKESDAHGEIVGRLAAAVLTRDNDAMLKTTAHFVSRLIDGKVKGRDPLPELREDIRKGLENRGKRGRGRGRNEPDWALCAALVELYERHPTCMREYFAIKKRQAKKETYDVAQMANLLGEVTGENVAELFKKHGVKER